MKAKSITGSSTVEIEKALAECMSDGFKPTLAIVFMSVKQDRKAIVALLSEKKIDILGATSCGEFINGHQSEGEIVVLLLNISPAHYSILYEQIGERTLTDVTAKISLEALKKFQNPGLIVCSTGMTATGDYFDGETFVASLEKSLGGEKIFFGGMAGDDWTFSGTYVFTDQQETDFGIVALVLDLDHVSMNGMAITGWKPMGLPRKVTKSKGVLLYTIDDKPATEMYFKYLGQTDRLDDKDFNMFRDLSIHYPLIFKRASGETALRSPMHIDDAENALVMDAEMKEGTEIWFTVPPDFDIAEEIIAQANQVKKELGDAVALLIFSCAGRPPVLGPLVTTENEGLANVWETPMAGFFTYGEYGRLKNGKQEFHSGACCWVALTEK